MKWSLSAAPAALLLLLATPAAASDPKPATKHTSDANQAMADRLNFSDKQDFEDAQKGFIYAPETLRIYDRNDPDTVVWDLEEYKNFITLDEEAPPSVNPSLWRNAQLNMLYGLFEVLEGKIYQVRGYDLSNITFVVSSAGWIVFDPLISPETAKAALDLINEQIGPRPVAAVVYSHSHIDHYGGAPGLFNYEKPGDEVMIIAPEGFTEHAVSENVTAGNAMGRRAIYMYGALLPRNPQGGVNGGLGQTTSTGLAGLLLPTRIITEIRDTVTVGDVRMDFQLTPGTEAPAEMNTWFPAWNALWMAENTTNTLHNILTLRGAQVRDAYKWARFLNETIERWGDEVEVKFQSHHWPKWGNERIVDYFKKQRDTYKFIHDQTVRLMNQGYNGEEISEMIELPPELDTNWASRGYYGTLRHNSRAVYQYYMGWYNGHPSDLNNLPPQPAAYKYIEYMGGEAEVLKKARRDFAKGEYRWVAEVMKHAVFADPRRSLGSTPAKELLADALEQLGYQAESGPWRSVYLQGAYELRNGVPSGGGTQTATPDTIRAMTPEMVFDFLAVHLLPEKATGEAFTMNFDFTDPESHYTLSVENAVLNYSTIQVDDPDVTLGMSMDTLYNVLLGKPIPDGSVTFSGDEKLFEAFLGMLDKYNFWFNIVTP